jgi:hypothetical protein
VDVVIVLSPNLDRDGVVILRVPTLCPCEMLGDKHQPDAMALFLIRLMATMS